MNSDIMDLLTEELLELVERAEAKRHLNLQRIESLRDYSDAKTERKKTKIYADCFKKVSVNLLEKYTEALKQNQRDLTLLTDANLLDEYAAFYREEVEMYDNIINEYYNYLKQGHIIDAFLGKERED